MDKLVVVETSYAYRLQWSLDDGDDMGAVLGEDLNGMDKLLEESKANWDAGLDREGWEHYTSTIEAGKSANVAHDAQGYYWETSGDAKAALRQVKAALKYERPMPSWASTAIANGWLPPKGWKP